MDLDGTILVVGTGSLGGALVRGMAKEPALRPRIQLFDAIPERAKTLAQETGVQALADLPPSGVVAVMLVVVKPADVPAALTQLASAIGPNTLVISCAAGVPIDRVTATIGEGARVIRAMPNVAAQVGASCTVLVKGRQVEEREVTAAVELFARVGTVHVAPSEEILHAVTALAASGPAFLALTLEAFMDAGVSAGLPRSLSEALTLEMARGTLNLLDRPTSPAELRAAVTSPGGTTAAGLRVLERRAARAAVVDAVAAAAERSRELARQG